MNRNLYVGTTILLGQALRRDRVLVSVWFAALLSVAYASAAATPSLYPTELDRIVAATGFNASPSIVALYGPILDVSSLGEISMTKMTVLYAVFVAGLFVVLVRRHTRTDEESGLTELIGGTALGRRAPLTAALVESGVVAVVLGLLTGAANTLGGLPLTGSLAFGTSWTGIGLIATGLSAVCCQLSASSRTCGATAVGVLGGWYLVRAVGDTSWSPLSWLSPFGWSTQLRAYSGTRWWVLGLYLALAFVLVGLALVLRDRRDLGAGLVADRPGRLDGAAWLSGPLGLVLRLNRSTLITWSAASAVLGAVLGAIAPNVGDLLTSPSAQQMMQRLGGIGAVKDTFVAAEISISAVVITGFAITLVGRAAADETQGRTTLVLGTPVSRGRVFAASTGVLVLGSAWLLVVIGSAVALGFAAVDGRALHEIGQLVPAALAQLPAVLVTAGLAALCWAWRSSWAPLGWGILVGFLTLGQLGELLKLPTAVTRLSPYAHAPTMPVEAFDPASAAALTGIGAAVFAAAWWCYRRRDLA